MKFGVCGSLDLAESAAKAGYEFLEGTVAGMLMPREPEEKFQQALRALKAAALPCPAVNCFIPGDLKLTGPQTDPAAQAAYVATVMRRAEQAGVRIVVFGSGGARNLPPGFARGEAQEQLRSFCRMVAPLARDHGVTVVVEPLNVSECNVLNTVSECATLVKEVDDPAIRLLVDAYHMLRDGDAMEDVVVHGALLAHAHLATIPNRLAPGAEACDFTDFFSALGRADYRGRLSIEGKIPQPEIELPKALALMRRLAETA